MMLLCSGVIQLAPRLRTLYLMVLTVCLGGTWVLEQPRNSNMEFYPSFVEFLRLCYACGNNSSSVTSAKNMHFFHGVVIVAISMCANQHIFRGRMQPSNLGIPGRMVDGSLLIRYT